MNVGMYMVTTWLEVNPDIIFFLTGLRNSEIVLQGRNNGRWWFPWGAIWWQNQWNRNRYHFLSQMVDGIIFSGRAVDHGHSLHQSVECCAQLRLPHVAATKITRCQEHTSRHWHFDFRAMLSLFSWACCFNSSCSIACSKTTWNTKHWTRAILFWGILLEKLFSEFACR